MSRQVYSGLQVSIDNTENAEMIAFVLCSASERWWSDIIISWVNGSFEYRPRSNSTDYKHTDGIYRSSKPREYKSDLY